MRVMVGLGGQGSNSAHLRQFNERVILTALRRLGEASKADLARVANLTNNTAGQIVRELEDQRLVRPVGKRTGSRGQPATLLCLNPEGAYAIGVKLGRRSVDALLVDFAGEVVGRRHQERPFPLPDEALDLVLGEVRALMAMVPEGREEGLAGLGLAIPYNLGSWARELGLSRAASQTWNSFDLGAHVRRALRMPVFVENDGTAVAVAELFQGHGRQLDDFACVYIGTATGGGLVLGGQYRRGPTGNAADIGLMPTGPSRLATAPAPKGQLDILLNRASIAALIRHLHGNGVVVHGRDELEAAIAANGDLVGEWLDDCIDALVPPLMAMARLLDVAAIVVDGDLPRELVGRIIAGLEPRLAAAAPESRPPPELRQGTVGPGAAAMGAALLPLHLNYSPSHELLIGH